MTESSGDEEDFDKLGLRKPLDDSDSDLDDDEKAHRNRAMKQFVNQNKRRTDVEGDKDMDYLVRRFSRSSVSSKTTRLSLAEQKRLSLL